MRSAHVPSAPETNGQKQCIKCGTSKPVKDFGIESSKADVLRHICKSCDRARAKRYRDRAKTKAVGKAYRESLRRGRHGRMEGKGLHVRSVLA